MTPDQRLIATLAGYALAALVLLAAGAWAGHAWRDRSAAAELAECRRLHASEREAAAAAAQRAEHDYRAREAQIHAQHQEIVHDAQTQTDQARADADRVRAALERLRRHLATSTAGGGGAPAHSAAASSSAPASATANLPADLLGRLGEAAAELAAHADAARTAGTACERAYQSLIR